jgi:hypothetical protein
MTDNYETGGPAFPVERQAIAEQYGHMGMTLRDYFAAKAMQSFIEKSANGTCFGTNYQENNLIFSVAAYAMADAMLRARALESEADV